MLFENTNHAREFAANLADIICSSPTNQVMHALIPIITDKNPFRLLDLVGSGIAVCPTGPLYALLNAIADTRTEGGWVVIASALNTHRAQSSALRLEQTQGYIIQADIWYGADIFGERVPGPFLLTDFDLTLPLISPWANHPNPWVRRTLGVAVHFWAKRTRSLSDTNNKAGQLFDLLSPLFEEHDIRAAKGIGWGLKTLGRYYPQTAVDWLHQQLIDHNRQPVAIVRRKALTYLPDHVKQDLSR